MSSAVDESASQQLRRRRIRLVSIVCSVMLCLAAFYVLLSAPLLVYASRHVGSSIAGVVNGYMQPLVWADDLLTPEFSKTPPLPPAFYADSFHRKGLYWYYGLWGMSPRREFERLRAEHWRHHIHQPYYP